MAQSGTNKELKDELDREAQAAAAEILRRDKRGSIKKIEITAEQRRETSRKIGRTGEEAGEPDGKEKGGEGPGAESEAKTGDEKKLAEKLKEKEKGEADKEDDLGEKSRKRAGKRTNHWEATAAFKMERGEWKKTNAEEHAQIASAEFGKRAPRANAREFNRLATGKHVLNPLIGKMEYKLTDVGLIFLQSIDKVINQDNYLDYVL